MAISVTAFAAYPSISILLVATCAAVAPPSSAPSTWKSVGDANNRLVVAVELTPNNEVIIPPKVALEDEQRQFLLEDFESSSVSKSATADAASVGSEDDSSLVAEANPFIQPDFSVFFERTLRGSETRCYCNLPECVSSNYMCKSPSGRCFTEVFDVKERPMRTRNGCMELLTKNGFEMDSLPKSCAPPKSPESVKSDSKKISKNQLFEPAVYVPGEGPLLKCCGDDFCNYGNMDILNYQPDSDVDDWLNPAKTASDLENERKMMHQALWFKAATIGVPIGGGFILIILLALAYRLYKRDAKRDLECARQRLHYLGGVVNGDVAATQGTIPPSGTRTLLLDETRVKDCCCVPHYHVHQQPLVQQQVLTNNNGVAKNSQKPNSWVIHHCQLPDPHRHICVEHGCPSSSSIDYRVLPQVDFDADPELDKLPVSLDKNRIQAS